VALRRGSGAHLSDVPFLRRLVAEARGDPATLALVLTGSRAAGTADHRSDELGARLHAAESATYLLKALFALECLVAPYLDRVGTATLAPLASQGWREGELEEALLRLVRTADPRLQQELERRVEALMESRGVCAHDEWGEQLERLKAARF
jgi:hypothetical protein